MSIFIVLFKGMFPSLIYLSKGLGETMSVHGVFPCLGLGGGTDHLMCHALFIALFQPKSESTEAKDRRQSRETSEWRDNSKIF